MKKFLLTAVCAAFSLISVTGCGLSESLSDAKQLANNIANPQEPPATNLIIISGYHKNTYVPDWSLIEDTIIDSCEKNADVTLIINDGQPYIQSVDLTKIDTSLSKSNFESNVNENAARIIAKLMSTNAKTPEVDTFSALALAERCINPNAENKIIIIDNMLSTAGKINFCETPLYCLDIESSAKTFENSFDFSNAEISVYGTGEVCEPQAILSGDDYNNLCDFWQAFFEGQECNININKVPYTNHIIPDDSLPDVSAVLASADTNQISSLEDNMVYELPTSAVSFKPNSAEFTDRETAKQELSDFAKKLTENDSLVLCGMTASYGDAKSSEILSLHRAESVRSLLLEIGVNSQISCIGTGFSPENPLHINDLNSDGSLNEEKAQKNRTVLAMTENTAKTYGII